MGHKKVATAYTVAVIERGGQRWETLEEYMYTCTDLPKNERKIDQMFLVRAKRGCLDDALHANGFLSLTELCTLIVGWQVSKKQNAARLSMIIE